jgi:dTDP-L-rhamnose 4-epimerase
MLWALHQNCFRGRLVLASSMVVYGEGTYRCRDHGLVRPRPRSTAALAVGCFEPECPRCDQAVDWLPVTEDAPVDPSNVYAATKVHQEHLCAAFAREHDVPVTALRYHNVYGPGMPRDTVYAGVASLFRSRLAAGLPPTVFEDGAQTRDFIHVDDVARANLLALTAPDPYDGPLNVASGHPLTVLEMARAVSDGTGSGLVPVVTGEFRPGDVRHIVASPDRARDTLGFVAEIDPGAGLRAFARDPLRPSAADHESPVVR